MELGKHIFSAQDHPGRCAGPRLEP